VDQRPFLAVRAIIPDAEGRILVLQRAPGSMAAGRWCLPGGKVDFGETAEAAVAKEVREETGLVCESSRFLFYQDSLPDADTPMHFVNLYFECRVAGTIVLNGESSQFAWLRRDEADLALAFGNGEGLRRYWHELFRRS
jgi:8-oxo-dGTP diphosphatase